MWWQDWLFGFWNGLTAWLLLVVHVFGSWQDYPLYDMARNGNWYDFGFLLGAGSPILGALGTSRSRNVSSRRARTGNPEGQIPA